MKIVDILITGEDDAGAGYDVHRRRCGSKRWKRRGRVAEVIQSNACLVPRLFLSRLMSSARKLRRRSQTKNRCIERESKRGRSLGIGSVVIGEKEVDDVMNSTVNECDGEFLPRKALVDSENLEEGGYDRKITYFNLAIGICLVHLIVSSKKEFSEMTKLRKKVELVVQTAKEKFQNKDSSMFSSVSESDDVSPYTCTTDAKENITISNDKLIENPLDSEPMGLCDQSLPSTPTKEGNCIGRMDLLETEMEFELERLQHLLDMEEASSDHPTQLKTEILSENFSCEGSNTSRSFRQSIDYPKAMNTSCGVNPTELDMKLHELLEMRQEERIKELETALNIARQKLYEKEQELCWWKDTARIMHEHVS